MKALKLHFAIVPFGVLISVGQFQIKNINLIYLLCVYWYALSSVELFERVCFRISVVTKIVPATSHIFQDVMKSWTKH